MSRLYLVSCCKEKAATRSKARDLYTSQWFKLARRYVVMQACPWYILSAKWELLDPDRETFPYDFTLRDLTAKERSDWGGRIVFCLEASIEQGLLDIDTIIILAGKMYRNALPLERLEDMGIKIEVPMRGLGIGQQKAWFANHLREAETSKLHPPQMGLFGE